MYSFFCRFANDENQTIVQSYLAKIKAAVETATDCIFPTNFFEEQDLDQEICNSNADSSPLITPLDAHASQMPSDPKNSSLSLDLSSDCEAEDSPVIDAAVGKTGVDESNDEAEEQDDEFMVI